MTTNNRLKIRLNEYQRNTFYQLPQFLFNPEFIGLSNNAKVLYSLLMNRLELSIKNKWVNENGEVFLLFKRETMQKMLQVSNKTAIATIKELIKYNLIIEERQGQGKPNKIYLLTVKESVTYNINIEEESDITRHVDSTHQEIQTYTTRHVNSTHQEVKYLHPNKTELNKIEIKESVCLSDGQTELSYINDENRKRLLEGAAHNVGDNSDYKSTESYNDYITYEEIVKSNIKYGELIQHIENNYVFKDDKSRMVGLVEDIILVVLDTLLTEEKSIIIEKKKKPAQLVKSVLLKLNYNNVLNVITKFISYKKSIKKKSKFLVSMLYNEVIECGTNDYNTYAVDRD